ncbi:MAG: histidine--tRNA ligase [Chloroflexi bacterium]|nr:histidine--tRNA ligase [Chloroflexota bacterium]
MSKMQTPRGMKDIAPDESNQWRHLRGIVENAMDMMNYKFITTPIVENVEVFTRTVGEDSDILSKEMYIFEDRGKNTLALRPEGTASVCRAYIEHNMANLSQPVKLAYFGPMFRYDRPQAGRYRQLWQFGAESIGVNNPESDAELIYLQNYIFNNLEVKEKKLKINSLGGLETRSKFEKEFKEFVKDKFNDLSDESKRRYEINPLRIFDSKEDIDQEIIKNAPTILSFLNTEEESHFKQVTNLLETMKIKYEIDPRIVRGLDYYTDTVWEFEPKEESSQSTIGAGGRYNNLIQKLSGKDIPGVGFATGVERTIAASKINYNEEGLDIYLAPLSQEASEYFFNILNSFTKSSFSFTLGNYRNSLRSQLRTANNINAKHVLILGNNELEEQSITIKSLESEKEDISISLNSLFETLSDLKNNI